MREFTTAVEKSEAEEDAPVEFTIDGTKCTAYQPSDGQFAMFMASTARHSSDHEQVAGIINFFLGLLDHDSATYVGAKLLDRDDAFGIKEVQEIMEYLSEEWAARPTRSPSGSTASPPSSGPSSTPLTPVST